MGCFQDQFVRDLNANRIASRTMTIDRCRKFCSKYTYAALQNGYFLIFSVCNLKRESILKKLKQLRNNCYCGNSYGKYLQAMDLICDDPKSGDCNCLTACSGDKNSFCGDFFANSVYLSASSSCKSYFCCKSRESEFLLSSLT